MEINSNLIPITFEEYEACSTDKSRLYHNTKHRSLYITRQGNIIECRYPNYLGHENVARMIYENLQTLHRMDESVYTSCMLEYTSGDEPISMDDVRDVLCENAGITDDLGDFAFLMRKKYLEDEEIPVQDLGFVKLAINEDKTFSLSIPNGVFNKKAITAAQKETIQNIMDHHNVRESLEGYLANLRLSITRDRMALEEEKDK